jgi:hypothetical protein
MLWLLCALVAADGGCCAHWWLLKVALVWLARALVAAKGGACVVALLADGGW